MCTVITMKIKYLLYQIIKLERENTKNIDVRFQIMAVRKLGSLKHRTKNRE